MGQEIEAVGVEMKAQRPGAAQVVGNRAHEPEEWNVVELAAEDTGDEGVAMDPEVSPEADVDETVATRLRLELERVSLDGDLPGVVRVITQLETALLDMEDHRLAKIEILEGATIETSDLEDRLARAPQRLQQAIIDAREAVRQTTTLTSKDLKVRINQQGTALKSTNQQREAVLDECDRLRGDIAALHATRDGLSTSINSTLGGRIDLQLSCRQLKNQYRETLQKNETRRGDLGRLERDAERKRLEEIEMAKRNKEAVQKKKEEREYVSSLSSELRAQVVQERQRIIQLRRDLRYAKEGLKDVKADNVELEEMLSKFEPGFSERIVARVAELNSEVESTTAHLEEARENCEAHLKKCAAETEKIESTLRVGAEKLCANLRKKEQILVAEVDTVSAEEQQTQHIYEGLKRSMLDAKVEIKEMNTKLMQATSKCSEIEEELDYAVQSHIANTTLVRENIAAHTKTCESLVKICTKKEKKVAELKAEALKLADKLHRQEEAARNRLASTKTKTAMIQEAERRATRDEATQRARQEESANFEKRTVAQRHALREEEEKFVAQHAINMKSAEARIFPARAAGYQARKELEKIEGAVNSIESQMKQKEDKLNKEMDYREELKERKSRLSIDKDSAINRKARAREMLEEAQAACRTVLAEVSAERSTVQMTWDVALVRHGVAQALNHRLVHKHAKVYSDVMAYRKLLGPLLESQESEKLNSDAAKAKIVQTYQEIREKHEQRVVESARLTEEASCARALQAQRVKSYRRVCRVLNEEAHYLDHLLNRAAEIKFENRPIRAK